MCTYHPISHSPTGQGEIFCIMGSSGSGKSTLLKILGGMEKPTSGTFYINGANMADYGQQDYDRHRQMTVGYCENNYPEQSSGGNLPGNH